MDKEKQYSLLVQKRKECNRCISRLQNPSTIKGGDLDSEEIGPYSLWQGDLNATLMVVGQDFADVRGFCAYGGRPGETVQTNLRLVRFLKEAGIEVDPPHPERSDDSLFFTNAVLCMKSGGMRGFIPSCCFRDCVEQFLRPMIELVAPKIIVTLGSPVMNVVLREYDKPKPPRLAAAVAKPVTLHPGLQLMPLYHPMASRRKEDQIRDWRHVGRLLVESRAA